MSYRAFACTTILALAACATSAAHSDGPSETAGDDGGALADEGGASDAGGPDAAPDGERPLVCGKTGFCETKLPSSDVGEPLSLRSVWLVSSTDVWSVSAEGFVLHWDGTTWTTAYRAAHALSAVWASATDVWVAGERGLLLHLPTGGTWTRIETSHVEDIGGIHASSAKDIWFGHDSGVDHFDGTTLTSYTLPVSGLKFRSVFGRSGFGAYAAYVECADCETSASTAFVFELLPGQITEVNPSLRKWGLSPIAGVVTEDADDDRRILLVGYSRMFDFVPWEYKYAFMGKGSVGFGYSNITDMTFEEGTIPSRPIPSWVNGGNDIRVQIAIGVSLRWDGTDFVRTPSIDMGHDFVPRTLFAVHGDETETWLVGDGFALKGPTQ